MVFVGFSVRVFSFQTSLTSRGMSWYVFCQGPREHAASLTVPVDYVNKECSSISPASFLTYVCNKCGCPVGAQCASPK